MNAYHEYTLCTIYLCIYRFRCNNKKKQTNNEWDPNFCFKKLRETLTCHGRPRWTESKKKNAPFVNWIRGKQMMIGFKHVHTNTHNFEFILVLSLPNANHLDYTWNLFHNYFSTHSDSRFIHLRLCVRANYVCFIGLSAVTSWLEFVIDINLISSLLTKSFPFGKPRSTNQFGDFEVVPLFGFI